MYHAIQIFLLPSVVSAVIYAIVLIGGLVVWRRLYLGRSRLASLLLAIIALIGLVLVLRVALSFIIMIGVGRMNP